MADDRLAITVTLADGTTKRWGPDELDHGDVPNDLTFSSSAPGGFKSASWSGLRDLTPRDDEQLFADVRIYGPGNRAVWEGRLAQLPRDTGNGRSVQPGAVGWSAHLEDDQSFMEVYVDRDPGSWGSPPMERLTALAATGVANGTHITNDGLVFTLGETVPNLTVNEVWWQGPGSVRIAKIEYAATETGTWTGFEAAKIYGVADRAGGSDVNANLVLDGTVRLSTLPAIRKHLFLRGYNASGAPISPPTGSTRAFTKIATYGDHGLTLRATGAGEPDGFYASDVIPHVLDSAAPMLNYSTGADGTIQPTTFAIPHLAFKSPTTAADAIAQVNAYHQWDWMVWEDRGFYFVPPASGTQWEARLSDGANLSLEGDTAEQIYNGVIVSYQDNGVQKYAGPVGSGMDVEHSSLQDTSVDNPVNAHGIPLRCKPISIGFPTTDAGAVQIGALALAEANLASRKGQITLQGEVRHPTEGMVPVSRVRAGDSIVVTDIPNGVVRRIIEVSYTHATRTAQVTLDSTASKVDALLERLAAVTGALT